MRNDINSDQLSLNDKKKKVEGKIGHWKTSFDLLRKQDCSISTRIGIQREIQKEIEEINRNNPSLISKKDFFMLGVEEAQQLLRIEKCPI